jgi:hypothetical protein
MADKCNVNNVVPPYIYILRLELSGAEAKTKQKSTRGSGTVPVMVWVYQPLLELPESGLDTDATSKILTWFMFTTELVSEQAEE